MKKAAMAVLLVVLAVSLQAQTRISDDLTGWTLGTNQPMILNGAQPDAQTGPFISAPLGCSPFYYPADSAGTGSITFWINDPGSCLDEANADGYSNNGPRWGLQTASDIWVSVGISRQSFVAGCQGYSQMCSEAPYSPAWFQGGVRGAGYVGGWYKWVVTGGMDDIQFEYNESVSKTYNATTNDTWAAAFGSGWQDFWVRGDASSGIEIIGLYVEDGSGIFEGVGGSGTAVSGQYEQSTWSAVKALYR